MRMDECDGVIWFDGEFVPWKDAKVHVLTHTLHYGMGVFEGIRAYKSSDGTAIFRLNEHIDRLFSSAHILNMKIPFDKNKVSEACLNSVKNNNLETAYIRPMCFYGSEGMGLRADGLQVHMIVAAWAWGSYLGAEGLEKGIRVKTSSFTRHHVNTTMCKAKANGNYINSMLALQDALHSGYDEALLLDANGNVAEGAVQNVFIVKNNRLITTPLGTILNGVTRQLIIEIAENNAIAVDERYFKPKEMMDADEAFCSGTAVEIAPIESLDDHPIGSHGTVGKITKFILQCFNEITSGKVLTSALTYVNDKI